MNGTSQVPPAAPGAPPVKKGMSPLAWIGIGCVVLLILCGIAFTIMGYFAKRAVDRFAKNPSITLKDEHGNPVTFNAKGKDGKFEIKTDKGTATLDASSGQGINVQATDEKGQKTTTTFGGTGAPQNLPSWLPVYPGGTVQGTYDTTNAEARTAAFTVTTPDASTKVIEYYESQLKGAGLTPEKSTYTANGTTGGSVTGKSADGKREAGVMVSTTNGSTQAVITFTEKK
jgi:hypothetical protein